MGCSLRKEVHAQNWSPSPRISCFPLFTFSKRRPFRRPARTLGLEDATCCACPRVRPRSVETEIFSAAALQVKKPILEKGRFFYAGVRHGANWEVQMGKMARRQKCLNHNTHFQIYDLSSNCFSTTSRCSPMKSQTGLPTDKTPRGKFLKAA